MRLPDALQAGIDELLAGADRGRLARDSRDLSAAYRGGGAGARRAARDAGLVSAYLATRAPATYAAVTETLRQVALARPGWEPTTVLDLGAGPGIAAWAVVEAFPRVAAVTLVEVEPEMARAGKALAARGPRALQGATWVMADAATSSRQADLVVLSYVLGEVALEALQRFAAHAWDSASDTLLVVEPGTTAGYERVLAVREAVLAAGGSTLAPCPHDQSCPLSAGDWCHFAVRLDRSRDHRRAKGAERGFEDEKFSYAVFNHTSSEWHADRVIRRPDVRQGHVVLDLCTTAGLERRTVSKRDGAAYKRARKLGWGDTFSTTR